MGPTQRSLAAQVWGRVDYEAMASPYNYIPEDAAKEKPKAEQDAQAKIDAIMGRYKGPNLQIEDPVKPLLGEGKPKPRQ